MAPSGVIRQSSSWKRALTYSPDPLTPSIGIQDTHGRLDALVRSAGTPGPTLELNTMDEIRPNMEVNFFACLAGKLWEVKEDAPPRISTRVA
jgi:NAD(P)-dependent dehydrogenase (short-subunit alcohol dehydrogenase family)